MAKTLSCDYNFNESNFEMVSPVAKVKMKLSIKSSSCYSFYFVKDFISKLLVLDAEERYTADQCLLHPWLTDNRVYIILTYNEFIIINNVSRFMLMSSTL